MSALSSTQQRALELLGQGVGPEQTALALGISVSAISQLLSDENFQTAVAERRFKNLAAHTERDKRADSLEDKLLQKMEDLLPFISKPIEAARLYQIVNGAKRRGVSSPEQIGQTQQVVPLILPTQIIQYFQVNSNNQVIRAGNQDLVTVQSGKMPELAKLEGPKYVGNDPATAQTSRTG